MNRAHLSKLRKRLTYHQSIRRSTRWYDRRLEELLAGDVEEPHWLTRQLRLAQSKLS